MYKLCLPHLKVLSTYHRKNMYWKKKKRLRDVLVSKLDTSIPGTMQLVTDMGYRATSRLTRRRKTLAKCKEYKEKKKKCWAVFSDRQKHWKKGTTGFISLSPASLSKKGKMNYLGSMQKSLGASFYQSTD